MYINVIIQFQHYFFFSFDFKFSITFTSDTVLFHKLFIPAVCIYLLKPKPSNILFGLEYLFSDSLTIRLVLKLLLHP